MPNKKKRQPARKCKAKNSNSTTSPMEEEQVVQESEGASAAVGMEPGNIPNTSSSTSNTSPVIMAVAMRASANIQHFRPWDFASSSIDGDLVAGLGDSIPQESISPAISDPTAALPTPPANHPPTTEFYCGSQVASSQSQAQDPTLQDHSMVEEGLPGIHNVLEQHLIPTFSPVPHLAPDDSPPMGTVTRKKALDIADGISGSESGSSMQGTVENPAAISHEEEAAEEDSSVPPVNDENSQGFFVAPIEVLHADTPGFEEVEEMMKGQVIATYVNPNISLPTVLPCRPAFDLPKELEPLTEETPNNAVVDSEQTADIPPVLLGQPELEPNDSPSELDSVTAKETICEGTRVDGNPPAPEPSPAPSTDPPEARKDAEKDEPDTQDLQQQLPTGESSSTSKDEPPADSLPSPHAELGITRPQLPQPTPPELVSNNTITVFHQNIPRQPRFEVVNDQPILLRGNGMEEIPIFQVAVGKGPVTGHPLAMEGYAIGSIFQHFGPDKYQYFLLGRSNATCSLYLLFQEGLFFPFFKLFLHPCLILVKKKKGSYVMVISTIFFFFQVLTAWRTYSQLLLKPWQECWGCSQFRRNHHRFPMNNLCQ